MARLTSEHKHMDANRGADSCGFLQDLWLSTILTAVILTTDTIPIQLVLSWTSSSAVPIAVMPRLTHCQCHTDSPSISALPWSSFSPRWALPSPVSVFRWMYSWSHLFTCPKPHQSCFPAPPCDVLYLQSLPDVIISHMVS